MQFSGFVARRFLFSGHVPGAVSTLSVVSMVGMGLGAMALVLVLSVFNGFHDLMYGLFERFDPDIKIVAARGRHVTAADSVAKLLQADASVAHVTTTLEGRAVLSYYSHQSIVVVKGVKADFTKVSRVEELLSYGTYEVADSGSYARLVMGEGVAAATSVNLADRETPMQLYTVTDKTNLLGGGDGLMQSHAAFATGIFSIQKEYNDRMVLCSYGFAERLFNAAGAATAIEVRLKPGTDGKALQQQLQNRLGAAFEVQNWEAQHPTLYAVLRNEKAVSYLVLVLMLVLLTGTIVGSLTMVIIEKQREIAVLQAMGATARQIQAIFFWQGTFSGVAAGAAGLALGGTLGYLQQNFGILKIRGGENFLVDAFPLVMRATDFILVGATVLLLAMLASLYPALRATQGTVVQKLRA
jgi:lipoprotein-releasing system permease protein